MTHARSSKTRSSKTRSTHARSAASHAATLRHPPPARTAQGVAPRSDAESLADHRHLADTLDYPAHCAHESCRRARRCRGPREAPTVFPGEAMPACLTEVFDAFYAPVARWNELLDMAAAAEAKLAQPPPDPDMGRRGGQPPNRSTR